MIALLSRRGIVVASIAVVAGAVGLAYHFQPDRRLARSWGELIASVESRKAVRLRDRLSPAYHDRWGGTRDSVVADARAAFFQLRDITLHPEQVQTRRDGDRATITALLRIEVDGPPAAHEARVRVNATFAPFTFTWQRDPDFPWSWKLEGLDHPEVDLRSFRHGDFPGL